MSDTEALMTSSWLSVLNTLLIIMLTLVKVSVRGRKGGGEIPSSSSWETFEKACVRASTFPGLTRSSSVQHEARELMFI